jgi:membrane associated rhomboid family serine protease
LHVLIIPVSDDNPLRKISAPWVTYALIAVNVAVFVFQTFGSLDGGAAALASFGLTPSKLFQLAAPGSVEPVPGLMAVPKWLTLITYQFVHGGFFHLFFNMLFLWVFGDNVEDAMGHLPFLVFYLVCGIAGGMAHAVFSPDSSLPLVGASGAIAGVIAAYLMLHPRVRVWVLVFRILPLRVPSWVVLGFWAAWQVIMLVVSPDGMTAWWAHVGGFVAGAVLVLFMRRPGVPLFDKGLVPPAIERRS